ncbi:Ig-like domain-containing protein [Clostridium sp. JNZ X4-2]
MKKKRKKISAIAVAILFVLQIFSSFGPIGSVKADEGSSPSASVDLTDTLKFITGVTLKDEEGNDISKAENVDKSSAVNVNYTFSIPGGTTVNNGDTYKIQLPEQIKISSEQTEDIKDSTGNIIASVDVDTSGKALITFNDTAASASDVIGTFAISAGFNEDKIGTETSASIDFKIDGQSPVTVNFKEDAASEDTGKPSTIG